MCGRCDFLSSALKISNEASDEEAGRLKTTIATLEKAFAATEQLWREERAGRQLAESLLKLEREKNAKAEKALGEARKLTIGGREW